MFSAANYLDFHRHTQSSPTRSGLTEIISVHLGDAVDVTTLPHFTAGMHPWFTPGPVDQSTLAQLQALLQHEHCLALGEVGLDKLKGPPMAVQIEALRSLLPLADRLNLPVVIHCVRAYDKLFKVKDEFAGIKNWVIHGYARHAELAAQALSRGFYLSLMPPARFNDKYDRLLKILPADRFFLETDDMPGADIEELYRYAAGVLQCSVAELKEQMAANARTFFGRV